MKKIKFNISDRKLMFMFLCIILVSIFSLTMAYAALSVTLNIKGNAEIVASSWDIHFDNLIYDNRKENDNVDMENDTLSFTTTLNQPGDKFGFVVDVVNEGSIDAIIESIEKIDDLTTEQAKYLKYEIRYASGESITEKQVLNAGSYVRLLVRVDYRSDVAAADLPTSQTTLNLSFKMNYVQKDEDGNVVSNNGTKTFRVVNGDLNTPGSEICLGNECFYLVEKTEDDEFQVLYLFAKYNLHIGGSFNGEFGVNDKAVIDSYSDATGLQNSSMIGADIDQDAPNFDESLPWHGVVPFSNSMYWDSFDANIYYNDDNLVWKYTLDYAHYLGEQGYDIIEAMVPPLDFLYYFGCEDESICEEVPAWFTSTSYWTMSSGSSSCVYAVLKDTDVSCYSYGLNYAFGVRPIIVIRDEK